MDETATKNDPCFIYEKVVYNNILSPYSSFGMPASKWIPMNNIDYVRSQIILHKYYLKHFMVTANWRSHREYRIQKEEDRENEKKNEMENTNNSKWKTNWKTPTDKRKDKIKNMYLRW